MTIVITNAGSYPRIGEGPGHQRLRQAADRWEKGALGLKEIRAVQDDVTREVLEEQSRAGLDMATDGQVRWYDPVSHLLRNTKGVEIGGLLRFFDTNNYFRQPIIKKKITLDGPVLLPEYRQAKKVSSIPVKPVITGPYTLACLSQWKGSPYMTLKDIVLALAKLVRNEVEALAAAKARVIQIDEPAILKSPKHIHLLKDAIKIISQRKGKSRLCLHTYFADATPIYEKLLELPVDIIGLDFTYGPSLLEKVRSVGSPKPLSLGLVDGRNTKLENPDEIARTIDGIIPGLNADEIHLAPSCGLEYLPRDRAFEKLKVLKVVKDRLGQP